MTARSRSAPVDPEVVRTAVVCDDDWDIRGLVSAILQGQGFSVHAVGDVPEALAAIAEGGVELVVSDISLPSGSGIDVCRAAHDAGAWVVAMTASVADDVAEALKDWARVVLAKPFSLVALLAAVAPATGTSDVAPQ
jgi:CheY-like chemotaxis protein